MTEWTRRQLNELLRWINSATFPMKPQIIVAQNDGTRLECYQTYANRLFVVIGKAGAIVKVYYGMGWNNVERSLADRGYKTQRFEQGSNHVRYLEIFPKEVQA